MRVSFGITVVAGLLLATGPTFANPLGTVNQIIAFGDSLSDSGNASIATAGVYPGIQGPGYYYRSVAGVPSAVGEFTNAPSSPSAPTGVWVDQLAPKLGVPQAQPFLAGGTNFAVASAVTGSASLADIGSQITDFSVLAHGVAPSNALYTIWGGANDILNLTNSGDPKSTGITAADNLYNNILELSSEGARYFIWANLPDLGKIPMSSPGASVGSFYFDGEWAADLLKLQADGISVVGLDVASLFAAIEANPMQYGFSNITTPAISVMDVDPDNYLFWDGEHPTAAADALIADAALDAFVAAPEPAGFGLAGLGLSAIILAAWGLRRRKATASA